MGEFNDLAKPGPYITIPGLTRVVSRVKVDSSQFLNLFRDESKPVLLLSGVKIKPVVVAKIRIMDAYAVTYNLSVHDFYVAELEAINVRYRSDEKYFYGLEEILTAFVRSRLAALSIEEVLELDKSEEGTVGVVARKDLTDQLQREGDKKLAEYGVDLEEVLIPEVEVLDTSILSTLQQKFTAVQNEKIAVLQEKVEKAQVQVEVQKAAQEVQKGKGAGSFFEEQMKKLKDQGLTSKEAVEFLATQKWADAAQKGANVKIITMGSDGKMSMPVMTGIGMGVGQDATSDNENKAAEKAPEKKPEDVKAEQEKTRVKPKNKNKK
ncbi:MAG: hypothetical protein Q8N37_02625 [bacterium]|nr:hypothetical protein [bacterium]